MTGHVYLITNLLNGKSYVGQTLNYAKRLCDHKKGRSNSAFHRAIKDYGWENFACEIIDTIEDDNEVILRETLEYRERYFILYYNTFEAGYNRSTGGKGATGHKFSEETKIKFSARPLHWIGRKHSDASKAKMSLQRKGVAQPNKVYTEETRKKMSLSLKGRIFSEETKQKMSLANKGRKLKPEHIAKFSKRVVINEETFPSITQASATLNIPVPTIHWRIKNNKTGYSYAA